MLALSWIIWPLIIAFICLITAYIHFKKSLLKQYNKNKKKNVNPKPLMEQPIKAIYPIPISGGDQYRVWFNGEDNDNISYLLTPREIVDRCIRHQQKIPFSIACHSSVKTELTLELGDNLLIKQ